MIAVAHVTGWCFVFWFPRRHRKLAWLVGILLGLAASAFITMLIIDTTGAVAFASALPVALAAIIFVTCRKQRQMESEQPPP